MGARPAASARPGYRRLWLDAASAVGADVSEPGGGFIEFRRGGCAVRVWGSWVPLDDLVTLRFADDKLLSRRSLEAAGLPVPAYSVFDRGDPRPAREFLAAAPGSCVVKPAGSSGGSGATSGVRTDKALRRALLRAGRLDDRLLIERQVPGDLYRLLFCDGELLDVIRRLPPRVTGDGRSTVGELVAAENSRRLAAAGGERVGLLRLDLDSALTLEQAALHHTSVPARGVVVAVKTVVNQNSSRDNVNVLEEVSGELVSEAAAAVAAVEVRLAGVDLITPDPGRPLSAAGGAILEVNGTPGLHYHYEVSNPERSVAVCVPILERLLAVAEEASKA